MLTNRFYIPVEKNGHLLAIEPHSLVFNTNFQLGKNFCKDVSKDQYINEHLYFAQLLSRANHEKSESIKNDGTKKFYDADITTEELENLLWEDDLYKTEDVSRETLIGIIRSYEKLGCFDYRFSTEKETLSIDELKDIIKDCERHIRRLKAKNEQAKGFQISQNA